MLWRLVPCVARNNFISALLSVMIEVATRSRRSTLGCFHGLSVFLIFGQISFTISWKNNQSFPTGESHYVIFPCYQMEDWISKAKQGGKASINADWSFQFSKAGIQTGKVVIVVIHSVCGAESNKMMPVGLDLSCGRWERLCGPVWLVTCQGSFTFLRNWLWLYS